MLIQFKVQLHNISKPPVWRKVLVPANFSFDIFHSVIQEAFGWYDAHLYQFSPKGFNSSPQIGIPDDSGWDDEEIINSKKIKLSAIFTEKGQKFTYIYDFGDYWQHNITLEDIKEGTAKKAELLDGKGACPPEDCGGAGGYEWMREVLSNPENEEYESMRNWLGMEEDDTWDAAYFDKEETAIGVKSV